MKHDIENHHESLSGSKAAEKIRAVAKAANVCLFGTALSRQPLNVRPMTVQSVDDAGSLWFLSSRSSHLNQQVAEDPHVQLLFGNPGAYEFMTLQGTAVISDDYVLRKKYWTPLAKTWFNEGPDDPDLTVICVEPHEGYYWDTKHGKVVSAVKIALGSMVGKTMDDSIEGEVRL